MAVPRGIAGVAHLVGAASLVLLDATVMVCAAHEVERDHALSTYCDGLRWGDPPAARAKTDAGA